MRNYKHRKHISPPSKGGGGIVFKREGHPVSRIQVTGHRKVFLNLFGHNLVSPIWLSPQNRTFGVSVSEDGLTAVIRGTNREGSGRIMVFCPDDRGKLLRGDLLVHAHAGEAAIVEIIAGTPEPK